METIQDLIDGNNKISLLGKTYLVIKLTKHHDDAIFMELRDPAADHGRGATWLLHSDKSNGFLLSRGCEVKHFRVSLGKTIEIPLKDFPVWDRMDGRGYAAVLY